ncbi:MAG TPA: tetratricopeptide repeat protein, partial [Gemmatimonadales bacterium]|nr:tetratricopeptide repeat protein [Gemmatimonadales bacterium]
QRCLQKEPDRRYQSADALLSELRGPTAGRQNRAAQRAGLVACGVLALTLGYSAYASRNGPAVPRQLSTVLPRTLRPGSIAIIPFTTPDSTSGRDYVTPGLTAELVRGLGSTPGIQVASWRSVHQAMSRDSAVPAMGRELGVAAVLKGTVRRAGDSVIIAAHLARSSDGRVLWSRSFDATAGKAIIAAEEVRHAVTVALGVHDSSRASRTERHAAADLVVYDLYLRGRLAYDKRTPAGLQEAALLFREAIARDSSFARAYVGLADVYTAPQSGPAAEGFRRAKPLIAHALAQDSMLAAAHKAAGWIAMWYDRDWSGAERHLRRALALDSSDVWAYHWYAGYLGAVGRTDESLAITRQATALDPVSSATATHVGIHLFWRRRYGEAIAVLERALEVDTTWARTHLVLARVYLAVGRHEDAIRELRRPGLQYAAFEPEAVLAYALGISGHLEEARDMAAKFEARARASLARPIDLVAVHLGLRDTARALEWVERIPEDRGSMFFLLTEPMYEPIRKSARFRRVLEKLGLPDAAIPADSTEAVGPAAQPTTFRRPS